MRIQPLYDLQQEINRLCIAGSKFAKDDPRLKKLVPVFDKLGEKAPVFKKISAEIQALAAADSRESADRLADLSVLLYSVLYTQGDDLAEAQEQKPQAPALALDYVNTVHSYAQLKFLRDLAEAKSGRLELVQEAFAAGLFNDFRTWPYLDQALGDKYSELADYVADVILPRVGPLALPFLLRSFRYEDKADQVRRLRAMSHFDFPELRGILDKIYAENLAGLQAAGISALVMDPANEDFLIKLAEDKNKKVREAAYAGLVKLGGRNGLDRLKNLFLKARGSALEALAEVISQVKGGGEFFEEFFQAAQRSFADLLALRDVGESGAGDMLAAMDKLAKNLLVLKNKPHESVPKFLLEALASHDYRTLIKNEKWLSQRYLYHPDIFGFSTQNWFLELAAIDILDTYPADQALAFYADCVRELCPDKRNPFWQAYLRRAAYNLPKEKVFEIFAPSFRKDFINLDQLRAAFVTLDDRHHYGVPGQGDVDCRWADLCYDVFSDSRRWAKDGYAGLSLLNICEPKESARFADLLRRFVLAPDNFKAVLARLCIIFERELPDRFELIYAYVSKYPSSNFYYFLGLGQEPERVNIWRQFPLEYAAKFRAAHEQSPGASLLDEIAAEIERAHA